VNTKLHDFEEKRASLRKNKNFYDYSEKPEEFDSFYDGIDQEYEYFNNIEC
jgi:hypothetical protein